MALRKGSLVVNSSPRRRIKDTWVLDDGLGGISADTRPTVADGTAQGFIGIDRRYRRRQTAWREAGPQITEERMRQQSEQQQQSGKQQPAAQAPAPHTSTPHTPGSSTC